MRRKVTRREVARAAVAGVAFAHEGAGLAASNTASVHIALIGLFVGASNSAVPKSVTLVETSGYHTAGVGGARYVQDPQADTSYVNSNPRTAFLTADGRGFRLIKSFVDVTQTGAAGDQVTDDTAAFQAALDHVERAGGGVVTMAPGDYKITAPLRLRGRVELVGVGQSSVIHAIACDAIRIEPSDAIGPRRLANFWLRGTRGEEFVGIVSDITSPGRAQGLLFEQIYIAFFGTGVVCRGLWHATFRSVTMNNVATGFRLVDRNVKILIEDARLTRGELLKSTDRSIGIQVGDGSASARPEDVQVHRSIIYGFAVGIVWRTALFGNVSGCDLDACFETGLELVTADGGFTFRDNWVQIIGGHRQTFGVNATALGYVPQPGRVTIADNRIGSDVTGRGVGIFVGPRQAGVTLYGNSVSGGWAEGLRIDGTTATHCRDNRITGSAWIGNTTETIWVDNVVGGAVVLTHNTGLVSDAIATGEQK